MKINEMIKEAHDNAVDKGFYDKCPVCDNDGQVYNNPQNFYEDCKSCSGTGIKKNRNIAELLMLIVSELGEALEAHRNNNFSDKKDFEILVKLYHGNIGTCFNERFKDTFEDEIADTFIRLFDLCGYLDIDIEKYIIAKMAYNKTRERKHGKKY